jgi:hypothetical protein
LEKALLLCLIAISLVALSGCAGGDISMPHDTQGQVTITQGLWGNVWFWEGNFMPGTSADGSVKPVVREVLIYEPTKMEPGTPGPLFNSISTKLIATTTSNASGFFQISLPPGDYSVFVKEGSQYYAGGGDGEGYLMRRTVAPGAVTKVQVDITYKAYE